MCPARIFRKLGIKRDSTVVCPTTVGVLRAYELRLSTSVGGPRSFCQLERMSNSPTHSITLEGIKEATWCDSYENCSANLTDQSFMRSREGAKHLQHVREPVAETWSETERALMDAKDVNTVDGATCLITYSEWEFKNILHLIRYGSKLSLNHVVDFEPLSTWCTIPIYDGTCFDKKIRKPDVR